MPENAKKNQDKKNDPKEQRKPRSSRNQAGKVEKRTEKVEESKSTAPKVPQKPPVYEDPGPDFYKNLKRETEEILKITEEENSKYKKKEIQSNWSKYEMPIESYEEIEEHDVGADYEKLIQAPLSIGGHFQFKHEKSWDVNTGASLYDKYFEIDMDNLYLAVSTIPFYERNGVDQSLFSETDMLSMNNRATKYKQKYYDNKMYATPETEAQDRILNSLKEGLSNKTESENIENDSLEKEKEEEIMYKNIEEGGSVEKEDINLDFKSLAKTDNLPSHVHSNNETEESGNENKFIDIKVSNDTMVDGIDDGPALENVSEKAQQQKVNIEKVVNPPKEIEENIINVAIKHSENNKKSNELLNNVATASKSTATKAKDTPVKTKKNPVIESPEDLEKWLDDFLDG